MAISSFHTYVIGADRQVGQYLSRLLAKQNLIHRGISLESRERPMLQSSARPVYVLTPSFNHPSDFADARFWLERAKEEDAVVILLSTLAVCKAGATGTVNEDCADFTDSEMSEYFLDLERVAASNPQHVILRAGQLFSLAADDFAGLVLNKLRTENGAALDMQRLFEPTPAEDVAEVILAVLRQINLSDGLWGLYHFSGVEAVNAYSFAEALLSEAGQFEDLSGATLSTESGALMPELWTPVADHQKLFHTFGIKQKAWRKGLARAVRRYYRADDSQSTSVEGR
ncbi:sugar nucleotide-binding protein [uncultured Thalassolituus sp.]|uniref:sugar nucleotide-binding protein n=1 Tax=uncultured Thalassolituus sp. TaxID=285273 RepID=UPI002604B133|nr:sugar nucleotide-binding protein [uncultured Thalassolituus sp.]